MFQLALALDRLWQLELWLETLGCLFWKSLLPFDVLHLGISFLVTLLPLKSLLLRECRLVIIIITVFKSSLIINERRNNREGLLIWCTFAIRTISGSKVYFKIVHLRPSLFDALLFLHLASIIIRVIHGVGVVTVILSLLDRRAILLVIWSVRRSLVALLSTRIGSVSVRSLPLWVHALDEPLLLVRHVECVYRAEVGSLLHKVRSALELALAVVHWSVWLLRRNAI